jgi:hypothetical protein
MGGFGFGQGFFAQYSTDAIPSIPPTNIASTELAASYIPATDLPASYESVTKLPASLEGTSS